MESKLSDKMTAHTAGASAGKSAEVCPPPTRSAVCSCATQTGHKRKTEQKYDGDDSEVTQHIRPFGQSTDTITKVRRWLDSDAFIDYIKHIWISFPEQKVQSFASFDPLWFQSYATGNYSVINWIKDEGMFWKKYIFVPIVIWSHWSLLIFCHLGESVHPKKDNSPCMLLLDSFCELGVTARLEPIIIRLLFDIYRSMGRRVTRALGKTRMPLLIPKVPQQNNGYACGYYVLYYIYQFLMSAPENFDIFNGYPYFMTEDWFTVDQVESFCQRLEALQIASGDDCEFSGVGIEYLGSKKGKNLKKLL